MELINFVGNSLVFAAAVVALLWVICVVVMVAVFVITCFFILITVIICLFSEFAVKICRKATKG